jgi:hypothetical protein
MMYCHQFGEQNRKSRMGAQAAQPEPGVVAQQQEMAAQEVRQEEANEEQAVQADHLDSYLRHLNVRTLQENRFEGKKCQK